MVAVGACSLWVAWLCVPRCASVGYRMGSGASLGSDGAFGPAGKVGQTHAPEKPGEGGRGREGWRGRAVCSDPVALDGDVAFPGVVCLDAVPSGGATAVQAARALPTRDFLDARGAETTAASPEARRLAAAFSRAGARCVFRGAHVRVEPGDRLTVSRGNDGTCLVRRSRLPAGSLATLRVPIDLSRADEHELQTLPGIGPQRARRIVETRAAAGCLCAVEELLAVPGIGPKTLDRLRERIFVSRPPACPRKCEAAGAGIAPDRQPVTSATGQGGAMFSHEGAGGPPADDE